MRSGFAATEWRDIASVIGPSSRISRRQSWKTTSQTIHVRFAAQDLNPHFPDGRMILWQSLPDMI
jgi:hypothetical protein